jgi:small-conductance mechanosensitive channel
MLTVMNREVMLFRATLLGLSPHERVAAASQRIANLLEAGGPGVVATQAVGDNTAITLDGTFAFFVTDGDANPLLDQDRKALARAVVQRLELVAREHAEAEQQPRPFAVAYALGVTVVWVLLLWALGVVRRAVQRRFAERAAVHAESISVGGARLFDRWTVNRIFGRVLRLIAWVFAFMLTYEWLGLVLQAFPYTRPWGERLTEFLIELARDILVATADAAPGLFVVVVIFFTARAIVAFAAGFFGRVQGGAVEVQWMDAHTAAPTQRLFTAFVWLFALAMAYPYLPGSGSQAFQGLSVLVGLMVSLGGASSIGQAVSGLIVMYTGTLKLGEYVRIGDQEGTVTELGAFQTRLRTGMGQELVLPNSMIVGSVVCNYSRVVNGKGFVVDAVVTIGYDAPWRQVHALLIKAAEATPEVAAEPRPVVFQTALNDFYVEYRVVCHAISDQPLPRAVVMSRLHASIQDAFNAAGVQIMSPHYLGDPATPKVVPKEQWDPK